MRRFATSLLLLLAWPAAPCFSGTAPAGISVSRGSGGDLLLSGPDCAALERQRAALAGWRAVLGEPPGGPAACGCAGGACSLDITAAAPEFVALRHGTKAGRWGPNCWNAALTANNLLARPRFTSPEEMTFWMGSAACRELEAGEAPLPGDIIAIRGSGGEEVHGFVYLTPELSFSKNYLTAAAPYELQSPEAVYAEFPVPSGCREPGAPAGACPVRSDYFRCSAALVPPAPQDPEYAAAEAAVAGAEAALSALVLNWKLDHALRARAPEILAAAEAALHKAEGIAAGRPGPGWQALRLRSASLLHQISLI